MNKRLVAAAAARLKAPTRSTPEQERMVFASMAAESLKLEGIDTSTEAVLAAAESNVVLEDSKKGSLTNDLVCGSIVTDVQTLPHQRLPGAWIVPAPSE